MVDDVATVLCVANYYKGYYTRTHQQSKHVGLLEYSLKTRRLAVSRPGLNTM